MENRKKWIDFLKGVAIFLVILGHSIQYGSGVEVFSGLFYDDPLFRFIYGFHMPFFMFISGYLFFQSSKGKQAKGIIIKKIKQFLPPIFIWAVPIYLSIYFFVSKQVTITFDFQLLIAYISNAFNALWYLWALLLSYAVVLIIRKFKGLSKLFISITVFLIFLFTSDHITISCGNYGSIIIVLHLFKFNFLFFLLGYCMNKYKIAEKVKSKYKTLLTILFFLLYIILIYFWKNDYYIYVTGFELLPDIMSQLWNNFYRIITGLVGVLSIASIGKMFAEKIGYQNVFIKIFCSLGKMSFGIYVISISIFYSIVYLVGKNFSGINYGITLIVSVCVITICVLIIKLIEKDKVARKILLGNNKK